MVVRDGVAFWLGTLGEETALISQVWGDPWVIECLFQMQAARFDGGSTANPHLKLDIPHPFDSFPTVDEEQRDVRKRWMREAVRDVSKESLVQHFQVPSSIPIEEADATVLAKEAICCFSGPVDTDNHALRLSGCLSLEEPDVGLDSDVLADATSTLHGVNNQLSVVAMSLDLMSLKLKGLPRDAVITEIEGASATAVQTVVRCGEKIREKLRQWHR